MSAARIASRYAKSLIELARDEGKLERVHEDVLHFQAAAGVKDLDLLLKSPIISPGKKKSIFRALFEKSYDPLTFSFLEIILRKGREMFLSEIADEFIEHYKEIRQITTVLLTTAKPMTEAQTEEMKKKIVASGLTYPNLDLITKVNPQLIGGFIIQIGDRMYDASVLHQLENMRKSFA